jgi:hypothetical protein
MIEFLKTIVEFIFMTQMYIFLDFNFRSCSYLCSYLFPLQHLFVLDVKRGLIIEEENSLGLDCG